MSVVAVVPLRDATSGKTRLAGLLPPDARIRLVTALARHVADALLSSPAVVEVLVVTADPRGVRDALAGRAVTVVEQPAPGLDAAAAHGLDLALQAGARRVLVIHADLPALTPADVDALVAEPAPVVLAPDRHGTGTNAVVLDDPRFGFRFGPGSLAAHRAEAARLGHEVAEVVRPGTAADLDTPEDWELLPAEVRARVGRDVSP